MQPHEFFHLYANTPLAKRSVAIDETKYGSLTLQDIYLTVKRLEDKMRPDVIERDAMLNIAGRYYHPYI